MSNIAIIPARGGSKRIPRKNIRPMLGRPMISWPITACLQAGIFDQVIVSTEDPEIATIARTAGAGTPFARPDSLSDDHMPVTEAVAHAACWLEEHGHRADTLTLVYPTAALLRTDDLASAQRQFDRIPEVDFLVSVTEFAFPIDRALIHDANGLRFRHPEHRLTRSQDLPDYVHDAAQFIFGRQAAWLEGRKPFEASTMGYTLPRTRVQDVDTEADWIHAEALLRILSDERP
jgi:pseudaminic acid cytidylyltransferase